MLAVGDNLVVNAYHESWFPKAWFGGSAFRYEENPTCLHLTDDDSCNKLPVRE